jgi:hypothetical protein
MEQWLTTVRENDPIALSVPLGVIGLDIDTYITGESDDDTDKRGGTELTRLENELGILPPTWMSTRRGPQMSFGETRTGIYLFQLPAWAVQADGEELVKFLSAPAPGIETIQYHERIAVCYPTVLDDMPYRWYGPTDRLDMYENDPNVVPWHEMPVSPNELPVLPIEWTQYLYRSGLSRWNGTPVPKGMESVEKLFEEWSTSPETWAVHDKKMRARVVGSSDSGGATIRGSIPRTISYRALDLDEAMMWASATVPGWDDEPNDFIRGKVETFITEFGRRGSRHDTTRDALWHVLWLCAGDAAANKPANPGGNWASQRVCERLLDERDADARTSSGGATTVDMAARDEISRMLVHAIAKLRGDVESGRITIAGDVYGTPSGEWDDIPEWTGGIEVETDTNTVDIGEAWNDVDWNTGIDDSFTTEDIPDIPMDDIWGDNWASSGSQWDSDWP